MNRALRRRVAWFKCKQRVRAWVESKLVRYQNESLMQFCMQASMQWTIKIAFRANEVLLARSHITIAMQSRWISKFKSQNIALAHNHVNISCYDRSKVIDFVIAVYSLFSFQNNVSLIWPNLRGSSLDIPDLSYSPKRLVDSPSFRFMHLKIFK